MVCPSGIAQVRWVPRLTFQMSSPLSLSAVTWHSPFSLPDLPYHSNQICDTNWDIMTMTTRVKCCVRQTLTGSPPPPPLPHPPPFPLFSLFSPLCRGPKPAKHISKWQLLRLSSKKPRLGDFPRLMWHLWPRNRVEGERWGPMAQWWFVWGGGEDGREGVKNQNARGH